MLNHYIRCLFAGLFVIIYDLFRAGIVASESVYATNKIMGQLCYKVAAMLI